ncbi:kielin/chordin-like protein [Sitophilus oryzae]|uniref:Kielin/chordin-like protein n=1 Tax=Sitophilus oryzae TaxID=7048 RepID=A0A6J2YNU6_SITOR|nr:kielin/chordin-like protein [Sitophilus oryzae]
MLSMSKFTLTFLLFTCICHTLADDCDQHGVLLYEDLHCKPVKNSEDPCPTSFDCDLAQPKSGCLFKGKIYKPREEIDSDLTYSACQIGCRCGETSTTCAVLDCPENLGAYREPNCYPKYELGKCCASGSQCENSTKTCTVDGTVYKVGQNFYPKNSCLSCVCHENFQGSYDKETCVRRNCAEELRNAENIRNNCAPAYFRFESEENALCCPNHWVCPEENDKIEVVDKEPAGKSTLECTFGSKKVPVGEGFKRTVNMWGEDRNLVCQCTIPPFLTCKQL